jgi:hypothetical protein
VGDVEPVGVPELSLPLDDLDDFVADDLELAFAPVSVISKSSPTSTAANNDETRQCDETVLSWKIDLTCNDGSTTYIPI